MKIVKQYKIKRSAVLYYLLMISLLPPIINAEEPIIAHTFSITGYDDKTGDIGIAVATKLPAVGMYVPFVKARVGAIASQAIVNPKFGPYALELMEKGLTAQQVKEKLIESDPDIDDRQFMIVDTKGNVAGFTGKRNSAYCNDIEGNHFGVAGNLLVNKETLESAYSTFTSTPGDLADKLLAALEAGEKAGGDKRGKQSAAILVMRPGAYFNDKLVALRVDDNKEPIKELRRIFNVYMTTFLHRPGYRKVKLGDRGNDIVNLQKLLVTRKFLSGMATGTFDKDTYNAIKQFQKKMGLKISGQPDYLTVVELHNYNP